MMTLFCLLAWKDAHLDLDPHLDCLALGPTLDWTLDPLWSLDPHLDYDPHLNCLGLGPTFAGHLQVTALWAAHVAHMLTSNRVAHDNAAVLEIGQSSELHRFDALKKGWVLHGQHGCDGTIGCTSGTFLNTRSIPE